MRLVIRYQTGDTYTWSATNVHPIEYESAEAALVHFEEACKAAHESGNYEFTFADQKFSTDDFFYRSFEDGVGPEIHFTLPEVLTVDEWFANP